MNAPKRIARVLVGLLCVILAGFMMAALGLVPASNDVLAVITDGRVGSEGMRELAATGRQLDELVTIEHRAAKTKENVTAEVIAGRLTLLQAAAHFSAADAELDPQSLRARLDMIAGDSDPERQCRKVIEHVKAALADEPSAHSARVNELIAELQDELRRQRTISLPVSATMLPRPI